MVSYYERNQMWKLPVGSSVTVLTANLILHSPDDPVIEAVFQVDFAPVEDEDGQPRGGAAGTLPPGGDLRA